MTRRSPRQPCHYGRVQTILIYLLVMALVVVVVFAVVWFVFGRGEDLALDRGTTLMRLPRAGVTGDVRALTFAQAVRGYRQDEGGLGAGRRWPRTRRVAYGRRPPAGT